MSEHAFWGRRPRNMAEMNELSHRNMDLDAMRASIAAERYQLVIRPRSCRAVTQPDCSGAVELASAGGKPLWIR